jgi:pimeloyl-ACP methyl ester carboxylesterase
MHGNHGRARARDPCKRHRCPLPRARQRATAAAPPRRARLEQPALARRAGLIRIASRCPRERLPRDHARHTRLCSNSGDESISFALLADDVAALIKELGLERPLVAGFSEGAITATILAIRSPASVGALVNHAGHDFFNPHAPSFEIMRQLFGGGPDAVQTDPDVVERFFARSPQMRSMFELMQQDQDEARGAGYWRTYLELAFDRTTRWPGYTFADLARIDAPTQILCGDRDEFCTVEEALTAYRALEDGELAILPNTGHVITAAGIAAMVDFLTRRGG